MQPGRSGSFRGWAAFVLLPIVFALAMLAYYRRATAGETSDPIGCVLILAFTAAVAWLGRPAAEALLDRLSAPARRPGRAAFLLIVLGTAAGLATAWWVLTAFANSGDEYAYVIQAETYARGRLWADPPAVANAFAQARVFDINGRWVSQYAPGWAIVLAPAAAVGLPLWTVGPFVGGLTLAVFHALARRNLSPRAAWLCTLAFGGSAFFLLNAASYFNHVLTAACGLAAVLFGQAYLRDGRGRDAVLAGAILGLLGLTRTQDVVPFGVVLAAGMVLSRGRRLGLVWLGLGGAPLLAVLGAYNHLITGDPLLPPQSWRGDEPIGGSLRPEAYAAASPAAASGPPTLAPHAEAVAKGMTWKGLESLHFTVQRLFRLWQWTSPVFLLSWPIAWISLARRRALDMGDWIVPVTGLMYLAYAGDGGNQYGPRYYFAAWPFALITLAKAGAAWNANGRIWTRPWIAAGLASALVLQVAYLPARFAREHRVVVERQAVSRAVAAAGLHRAIVVIEQPVGRQRAMAASDLDRNGLDVAGRDIIYAVPSPDGPAALLAAYPGRSLFLFSDDRLQAVQPVAK